MFNFLTVTPIPVDVSIVTEAIASSISPTQITTVIAAVLTAGVGFVVIWFGARKVANSVISAFKTGKIRF